MGSRINGGSVKCARLRFFRSDRLDSSALAPFVGPRFREKCTHGTVYTGRSGADERRGWTLVTDCRVHQRESRTLRAALLDATFLSTTWVSGAIFFSFGFR